MLQYLTGLRLDFFHGAGYKGTNKGQDSAVPGALCWLEQEVS